LINAMTEVHPNLFVGSQVDYEYESQHPDFFFVHVVKEAPALWRRVRAAWLDHPQEFVQLRANRLLVRWRDSPVYGALYCCKQASDFIHCCLDHDRKVLLYSYRGRSLAPSIALIYMARFNKLANRTFDLAEIEFRKCYPDYAPRAGFREFLWMYWPALMGRNETPIN